MGNGRFTTSRPSLALARSLAASRHSGGKTGLLPNSLRDTVIETVTDKVNARTPELIDKISDKVFDELMRWLDSSTSTVESKAPSLKVNTTPAKEELLRSFDGSSSTQETLNVQK